MRPRQAPGPRPQATTAQHTEQEEKSKQRPGNKNQGPWARNWATAKSKVVRVRSYTRGNLTGRCEGCQACPTVVLGRLRDLPTPVRTDPRNGGGASVQVGLTFPPRHPPKSNERDTVLPERTAHGVCCSLDWKPLQGKGCVSISIEPDTPGAPGGAGPALQEYLWSRWGHSLCWVGIP